MGTNKKNIYELKKLGDEQFATGNYPAAIEYYKSILFCELDDVSLCNKIGENLRKMEDYHLAITFLDKAISLSPNIALAYLMVGDIYYRNLNDPTSAIPYFIKHVEKEPNDASIYNIIGFAYAKVGNYRNLDEQIKYFQKALEVEPNMEGALRNLAFTYQRAGRYKEALESFNKLLNISSMADDYFGYACLKIKLGDFAEGWKHYQSRFSKIFGATPYPKMDKPLWEGQKISDKTLLIHYEQGYGDSIQFFRYLEQVKPLVKKIIYRVQDCLVDLLQLNANGIEIVKESEELSELSFDYHIPIMNLPHVLNSRIDNIPLSQGYIKADKKKINDYKEKFFNTDCIKIGISYSGAIIGNKLRNVPLEYFYPLTKIKNVKIYSFQKESCANQLKSLPPDIEIIDIGKTFNDFSDTAAAMANLDLFVTSDNAVFNLAGSMGKKTFVLLNKDAEWRWFLDEETTPWYDSVKIFKKQDENECWDIQMQRVVETIEKIQ